MATRRRRLRGDDLFRLRIPTFADFSPDGSSVVYAVKSTDPQKNRYRAHLFRVPARGGRSRQLTRGLAQDTEPRWSPDGEHIAFISKRKDDIPQIWILPVGGGEPYQLTQLKGGPVRQLSWSPDGRALLFSHRIQPKEDPEKKKLRATYKHITCISHKLDGDGFLPTESWHIWKASFPGGRTTQLTRGDHDDGSPAWSPDARRIAFASNRIPEADYHPANGDLFVVSASGRGLRQVTRRFGPVSPPAWSLDGRHLYYAGHFGKDEEWLRYPIHVYRIRVAGGEPEDLTPKLDQWPFNALANDTAGPGIGYGPLLPFRDPGGLDSQAAVAAGRVDEERVAFLVNEHGACRLYSIPAAGGPLRLEMGGPISVVAASVRADSGRAAIAVARMMDCGDIYTLRLDGGGQPRQLTRLNQRLFNGLNLTEPEEMIFGGARNKRAAVHGWILRPPGFRRNRRYPMVLYIHGGPMAQYGYTFFHELHFLAAQGYVVVFTNPRGSSGYGLRFMNCIENRWGTIDYDDLMAVVDSVARKPYVDGKRLGVAGGSYGGFMTTWIIGHTNRFKAAVTQRQAGNFLVQVGSSDFGFYRTYTRGSTPWETPLRHIKDSPNFYADRIRTPLLIIHSECDLRTPIGQAEELFTFLKLQRKTVEMVRFEGESHGLSRGGKPQNRLERLSRIADWLRRHL